MRKVADGIAARRAFSLLELLAVIVIMFVLMSMTQLALSSLSQSTKLTTGAQMVGDILNGARQLAVAQNQYVQVRLCFSPTDSTRISAIATYRADSPLYGSTSDYQNWETLGRFRPGSRLKKLPEPILIFQSAKYSTLLERLDLDAYRKGSGQKVDGKDCNWVAFYFRPDGAMDVKPASGAMENFLTLTLAAANTTTPESLVNYATIAIDPVNGRYRVLRP
jgi:uncharacterized protein (TIGR02596 family)